MQSTTRDKSQAKVVLVKVFLFGFALFPIEKPCFTLLERNKEMNACFWF